MVSKCVICGAELPMDMTQLTFATKNKGIENACMKHEFSTELKNYIKENGGSISIYEALHNSIENRKGRSRNDKTQ